MFEPATIPIEHDLTAICCMSLRAVAHPAKHMITIWCNITNATRTKFDCLCNIACHASALIEAAEDSKSSTHLLLRTSL